MRSPSRREFLSNVGQSMLAAGIGASLAEDLGCSTAFAFEAPDNIPLGRYAPLVDLMRGSPAESLQAELAVLLRDGRTDLPSLIAAGSLANAVSFGGCDYVGFHTAMALLPALEMSGMLAADRRPLPVLKVLYRNSQQIQKVGGASKKVLAADFVAGELAESNATQDVGIAIRDACRKLDVAEGERLLALERDDPLAMLELLQPAIQDDLNVHRFVMAHRTHGLARFLGTDYAYTLLRQCVRFCIDHEREHVERKHPPSPIRALLPKLLDQHKLAGKPLGKRDPGDQATLALANVVYEGPRERAADAVAAALAEGIDPEVVGEAISLASNLFVLRQGSDKKRAHGDAPGVHSSDATNAWRNMARTCEPRHAAPGLIVAGYHAGMLSAPYATPPYPTDDHRAMVKATDAKGLLSEADDAIRANDQGRATAAIQIYGERGYPVEPALALMLKYTVSEDGRLHGEKYFQTVREEYRTTRPSLRWRQIVGLARVTASAYGYNRDDQPGHRAPGYESACRILGVEA